MTPVLMRPVSASLTYTISPRFHRMAVNPYADFHHYDTLIHPLTQMLVREIGSFQKRNELRKVPESCSSLLPYDLLPFLEF